MRTIARSPRIWSIAPPLLVVTTALDESSGAEGLFATVADVTVLGVFGRSSAAAPIVDIRSDTPGGRPPPPRPALSLDRVSGERTRTKDVAALIADAIERSGVATVAVALGLASSDALEASDAALLARRRSRSRTHWIVYADADTGAMRAGGAGRITRRRMLLSARGIRLDPVEVESVPPESATRFWTIRAR